jgi:uncharacterized repeat protein (TIGR02543 family)
MATITKKYGESVTLTATPNSGYEFSSWSGDASGSTNPLTFTVTGDRTITANFSTTTVQNVIRYTLTPGSAALTGTWIENNTDTSKNTYDSTTGNGVFYLNNDTSIINSSGPFHHKSTLETIDLSDYIGDIGSYAFSGCNSLSSITFTDSLTTIPENCFENCSSLASMVVPNTVTSIGRRGFKGCSSLSNISLSNSLESIDDWAFSGCSSLTSITFPSSLTSINGAVFEYSGLTSVYIPATLTSIGGSFEGRRNAFSNCPYIESIVVDSENPTYDSRDNCNAIIRTSNNYLVSGCKNTKNIPSSVKYFGEECFEGCTTLTSVPWSSNAVLTISARAFYGCTGLITITIPRNVRYINVGAMNPFAYCSNLITIFVQSANNYYKSLNHCVLKKNDPNRNRLFFGCKSSFIPDITTAINKGAFAGITSLTSVTIPASVTSIQESAFIDCVDLESVTCLATTPPTLSNVNTFSNISPNAVLYVPSASLTDYQNDSYWSGAFSNIQAIQ